MRNECINNTEGSSSSRGSCRESLVSFSTIEIREHAMIMGCSPSTVQGPPIEIGWESLSSACFALEDFEENRPPRRVKGQMAMPAAVREALLIENGYTMHQIADHVNQMKKDRQSRSSLKMPIRMLSRAKRSFMGALSTSK